MQNNPLSAQQALEKLRAGNQIYLNATKNAGDISPATRLDAALNGQHPYAVVVCCSDSRVIPESIFSAGIGELFTIRVAGNVVDGFPLGSIEYAVGHLHAKLVLVLGHTCCGAVASARGVHGGYLQHIADEIKGAIGSEEDPVKAAILNVEHTVKKLRLHLKNAEDVLVAGALYHTDSGAVEFL